VSQSRESLTADKQELYEVLLRYCRGLDRVDMNLVRGAFHADAWIQFPESLHIGSVDGLPADLSAQKKRYLRSTGYGRKRPRFRKSGMLGLPGDSL